MTEDGAELDVDVVLCATGYAAADYLGQIDVVGEDGASLRETWSDGAYAYLGMAVPGFPNFFMLYGPNTNVGSNSVIFMLEAQARYIVRALKHMRRRRKSYVAVRPEAMATFIAKIDEWMQGTVWLTRCSNYFRAANGRVVTQWPRSARAFWAMTRRFTASDYTFDPPLQSSGLEVDARTRGEPLTGVARSTRSRAASSRGSAHQPGGRRAAHASRVAEPASPQTPRATLDTTGVSDRGDAGGRRTGAHLPWRPVAAPAVIYCHSGAFVLGNLDTDQRQCVELARRGRCTVISVDYRLAPEHPFPAALDDATTVLEWAADNGTELDVDIARLAVAGSSAGGALAARLAQRAADGSAPRIVFQLLHQPVLDDRPTPSTEEFDSTPGFDGPAVDADVAALPRRAAVPRLTRLLPAPRELSGVPAALITCSELDPLRDEAVDYARAADAGWGRDRAARVSGHLPRIRRVCARLGDDPAAVRHPGHGAATGASRLRAVRRRHNLPRAWPPRPRALFALHGWCRVEPDVDGDALTRRQLDAAKAD